MGHGLARGRSSCGHDPIGGLFYSNVEDRFAEFVLVGQDDAGDVVALAFSIPFQLDGNELPLNGWDGVIRNGVLTAFAGEQPDAISAIEIAIRPDHQNQGLSAQMLVAMRDNAARHGFPELVAPVRPSHKPDVHTRMEDYAFQVRDDGLPVDPWLRVHVRAGGVIDKVAPRSMVIPGTLEEWREWTGLPFDRHRPGRGAAGARPGPGQRGAGRGDVRRAERLGPAPHRRLSQAAWPIVPGIAGGTQAQVSLHAR